MKKFLALLCMITCIFGLTACGNEDVISPEVKAEVDSACQYVFGFTTQDFDEASLTELKGFDDYEWQQIEAGWRQQAGFKAEGNAIIKGIESFQKAKPEIGNLLSVKETTYKVDDDSVIAYVELDGDIHDAQIEVIFDEDLKVTSITTNVQLSLLEKMENAVLNTLLGMGTVFVVLILIMLIISCFKYISKFEQAMEAKKKGKESDAVENTIAQIIEKEEVEAETTDDLELAAVIAASIAASEGKTSTEGFVVRSIRKRK